MIPQTVTPNPIPGHFRAVVMPIDRPDKYRIVYFDTTGDGELDIEAAIAFFAEDGKELLTLHDPDGHKVWEAD